MLPSVPDDRRERADHQHDAAGIDRAGDALASPRTGTRAPARCRSRDRSASRCACPSGTSARAGGTAPPIDRGGGRAGSPPARRRGSPSCCAAARADRRGIRARALPASPCRRTRTASRSRGARAPATAAPPASASTTSTQCRLASSPAISTIVTMLPDRPSTDQVRSPGRHDTSRFARARRSCQSELSKWPRSTFDACSSSRRSASSCTRRTNRLRP